MPNGPYQQLIQCLYTVPEARDVLGNLSHSKFYGLVRSGAIALTKIGRRSYVTAQEIERFVQSLQSEHGSRIGAPAEAMTVPSGPAAPAIEGDGDA